MDEVREVERKSRDLRVRWHVYEDVFTVSCDGELYERLTPYGLACQLRELGLGDRAIASIRAELGRRQATLPVGMIG